MQYISYFLYFLSISIIFFNGDYLIIQSFWFVFVFYENLIVNAKIYNIILIRGNWHRNLIIMRFKMVILGNIIKCFIIFIGNVINIYISKNNNVKNTVFDYHFYQLMVVFHYF